jgi:hypothetical protein
VIDMTDATCVSMAMVKLSLSSAALRTGLRLRNRYAIAGGRGLGMRSMWQTRLVLRLYMAGSKKSMIEANTNVALT